MGEEMRRSEEALPPFSSLLFPSIEKKGGKRIYSSATTLCHHGYCKSQIGVMCPRGPKHQTTQYACTTHLSNLTLAMIFLSVSLYPVNCNLFWPFSISRLTDLCTDDRPKEIGE